MDPLIIGTPEQFEALRMGLIELGYSVEAICQRTGTDSIFRFKTIAEGRERTEVSDGLDVLVRLLMDGETLAASLLTRFLPAGLLAAMQALGLVRGTKIQPDQLYATAALYPVAGLYVASDRTLPVHGEDPGTLPSDVVYAAITGNTGRFLSALPESPCEDFLDLCSGTGIAALVAGARFARETAMAAVEQPYDVVVTTNSGYPLDQNLYQAVKGMRAAAQIVRQGGAIVIASQCADGLPDHGRYKDLLHEAPGPDAFLELLGRPQFHAHDQWQVQVQAQIQRRAQVHLHTDGLTDTQVAQAHMQRCLDVAETAERLAREAGPDARIAVLPQGPQTIPYVAR